MSLSYLVHILKKFDIYIFRRKYPDFVQFVGDFLRAAECPVCKDNLDQTEIILTNPCGHILCADCSCQYSRMWQDGAEPHLRCPVCHTSLVEHKFSKPYSIRTTKMNATSLFTWVPTSLYVNTNYDQLLIEALTNRDFEMAFGCAFFLGKTPDEVENMIALQWGAYYQEHVGNMTCSCCKIDLPLARAFMSSCYHFYCTTCSAMISGNMRHHNSRCLNCNTLWEADPSGCSMLRPSTINH